MKNIKNVLGFEIYKPPPPPLFNITYKLYSNKKSFNEVSKP